MLQLTEFHAPAKYVINIIMRYDVSYITINSSDEKVYLQNVWRIPKHVKT
jgi:hypothetical protein